MQIENIDFKGQKFEKYFTIFYLIFKINFQFLLNYIFCKIYGIHSMHNSFTLL